MLQLHDPWGQLGSARASHTSKQWGIQRSWAVLRICLREHSQNCPGTPQPGGENQQGTATGKVEVSQGAMSKPMAIPGALRPGEGTPDLTMTDIYSWFCNPVVLCYLGQENPALEQQRVPALFQGCRGTSSPMQG